LKNFKLSRKAINYSLLCGLVCAVFLSFSSFNTACDDLRENVLRLHIIANSNSAADQQLKLSIRDRILENSKEIFADADSMDEAIITAKSSIERIEQIANDVISEKNFGYTATAKVKDSYFETREYDNFTLPAGTYKSVVIDVGKAKGKNWWCVIFPEICLPSCSEARLTDTVSESSAKIAEDKPKYEMRFKIVEFYEDIKRFFLKI